MENPLYYIAEGFRQYFQADGSVADRFFASFSTSPPGWRKYVGTALRIKATCAFLTPRSRKCPPLVGNPVRVCNGVR
ncbi:hypothetical protein [Mucilaginibacter segetis]|uniref:hypothetical protein n=1 Tax=Mucilaginibacter segetis TaxID=2793071 RepID=UPI001F22616C|nr:hypothetical protein [Mucilaginibacter segetis]